MKNNTKRYAIINCVNRYKYCQRHDKMEKSKNILLIFLLLTINLPAQIAYDTIPDKEEIIGGWKYESLFEFKNFENQVAEYFNKVDFKNIDCYGKTVFVATTFGKNGKLKNTKIVKSVSPACDSIAFYFVNGLKDWLPGLHRGKFVDIPFLFPITFDSVKNKHWQSKRDMFFDATEKEYNNRKKYFDFFYSQQYDEKIINDFNFFKNYIAEVIDDNRYVYILTNYKLKRKESVVLKFNNYKSKYTHLLVRNSQKDWILYEYDLKKGKVRIPKHKHLLLIFYKEETPPLLQTMIIDAEKDTTIDLRLEYYTKGKLLDEINKYRTQKTISNTEKNVKTKVIRKN